MTVPADTGRPGYHPATLLKLYRYGYLNRVPSSRRLEREAQRNLEGSVRCRAILTWRDDERNGCSCGLHDFERNAGGFGETGPAGGGGNGLFMTAAAT